LQIRIIKILKEWEISKSLIFNADDYGRSPEISEGIRAAHKYGVVTSTTCMMNIATTADDISLALKESPMLGLGVHLVLTMGQPLSAHGAVKSLTDQQGSFFKYGQVLKSLPNLNSEEVRTEWQAQIDAFIKAAGKKPDHLDSHHHASYFSPALFRVMLELAKEYDCPIRFPFTARAPGEWGKMQRYVPDLLNEFKPRRPDHFIAEFYDQQATSDVLIKLINELGEGVSELMCHPGFVPDAFVNESTYNTLRQRELGILIDPAIRNAIEEREIELINFARLQPPDRRIENTGHRFLN
jgi:predicted glycoside hydrolase/deacetylase ChbG (UPF0249 family)